MKTQTSFANTACWKTGTGRLTTACATKLLPLLLLLILPATVQAQFNYTTTNGTITITRYTGSGSAVTIPDRIPDTANGLPVTSIGDYAFFVCSGLTNVTMGTNVTSIGEGAFQDCENLTSVTIPSSVTNIGMEAFSGLGSPTAITVDTRNSVYSDVDGVLFNKSLTTLVEYPGGLAGSYTIPNSVTNIGGGAFAWCNSLTNVTIGTNVTKIGDSAFSDCWGLTNITIPNSVTKIGDYAFYYCFRLTNVTIGNGVTSIGDYAFSGALPQGPGFYPWGCPLTSVTIPSSVTNIGSSAFAGCLSLTSVYFQGNAPSFGTNVFDYWGSSGGPWEGQVWDPATIYCLPATTGWSTNSSGLPVVLWTPQVQTSDASFGVRTNQFGFTINWANGMTVLVEASTSLVNPTWFPISTNTLSGGSSYFSDPHWANYPARFYQLRWP